jgi:hypothetical protein
LEGVFQYTTKQNQSFCGGMKHEKIIKREDGSRVRITVLVSCSAYGMPEYVFCLERCKKGKRKFISPYKVWELDKQPENDRLRWITAKYLQIASKEEIQNALDELHQKLAPRLHESIFDHPEFI